MKSIVIATLLTLTTAASAHHSFETVTEDASMGVDKYSATISYPELTANSVPAYALINEQLKNSILQNGCISELDSEETINEIIEFASNGMDYSATGRIVGLNSKYVGVEVVTNSYCGGAYPNHSTINYTFDSNTGEMINLDKEIPASKYDHSDNAELTGKLTEIVLGQIKAENRLNDGCYEGMSESETLENIKYDMPSIVGLARGKQVIIATHPARVMLACKEIFRVDYSKVKGLIPSDSKLHTLLK